MEMSKWDHKDEWHRHGKYFLVVVKRYSVGESSSFDLYEGPHRWAVYAYVYPKHRLFGSFHGPAMWQPAAAALPLILQDNDRRYDQHPVLDLIRRPNGAQGRAELLEAVYGYLLLTGNAYVEAVPGARFCTL